MGLALAEIDVACALAELAVSRDWTRPIVDDSLKFVIEGGRHPSSRRRFARAANLLSPTTPIFRAKWPRAAAWRSSPAPIWRENRPICVKTR